MANWVCPECGNDNPIETKICEVCNSHVPAKVIEKVIEQEKIDIQRQAEEKWKDYIYNKAKQLMSKGTSESYEVAIDLFKAIPDWRDSDEQIGECQTIVRKITYNKLEKERKNSIYDSAVQCMQNNTIDGYFEAIQLFNQIRDMKGVKDKIDICKIRVTELQKYNEDWNKNTEKTTMSPEVLLLIFLIPVLIVVVAFIISKSYG